MHSLTLSLYEIGAIQFGDFTLKGGTHSPIYIDLRLIISYPSLLKQIGDQLWKQVQQQPIDLICGIPYAALPVATAISIAQEIPMVICRKERKDYGTKKLIEGKFQSEQTCLVVEDVITSGASIIEIVKSLRKEGLKVNDAVVMINREQGGETNLKKEGIVLHQLLTISDLIATLQQKEKISAATAESVRHFLTHSH